MRVDSLPRRSEEELCEGKHSRVLSKMGLMRFMAIILS
jgi:hypothetical protein